ncbi:MAG: hypothetical protein EBQ73_05710 [Gammaproteobacteria bacterium]|nr:hypothetical protein [Gammaproteobacteria bacterium]
MNSHSTRIPSIANIPFAVKPFLGLFFLFFALMGLLGVVTPTLAEPHILVGPSEPDEEPEAVETISGLSYDQLKKLRELRKWLDDRQKIRDERDLKAALTQPQSLSLFKEREILTPLGQRAPSLKIKSQSQEGEDLKLPPLPRFDESKEESEIDEAIQGGPLPDLVKSKNPSKVTHITPPPPWRPSRGGPGRIRIEPRAEPWH